MRLFAVIAGLLLSAITQAATIAITVQHPVMDSAGRPLIGDAALIDFRTEYGLCADPFVPIAAKIKVIQIKVVTFTVNVSQQYCARVTWRNKLGEVKTIPMSPDPRAGLITSFTVSP